jgi:hypothetical protein
LGEQFTVGIAPSDWDTDVGCGGGHRSSSM